MKKLNSSNDINQSASEEMSSNIAKSRITAQEAVENVHSHSVLVAIYNKITKKSKEGLSKFTWKRPTLSPEVKYILAQDGYKITQGSGADAIGFVISW